MFRPGTYIPQEREQVPISEFVSGFGREDKRIRAAFEDGGVLAASFPGYSMRPPQHRLAQMTLRAFELRKTLLAEAGTGTGKSFGLLIPAIEYSMRTGQPVVVATATNALLDQYKTKDLPALERMLQPWMEAEYGRNFAWASIKGRANYFCHAAESDEDLSNFDAEMTEIQEWSEWTETGDLAELEFEIHSSTYRSLKLAITMDSDECPGQTRCSYGQSCYYYRAKAQAAEANIILVSHATVAIDLVLGNQMLPPYGAVVIDEAHQFVRYVQSSLEEAITANRFRRLAKRFRKLGVDTANIADLSAELLALIAGQFRGGDDKLNLRNQQLPDSFWRTKDRLVAALDIAEGQLTGSDNPKAEGVVRSSVQIRGALDGLRLEPGKTDKAVWAERRWFRGNEVIEIHSVPVDVSRWLEATLWKRVPAVLSSATLATGEGTEAFDFITRELGVTHPLTMQVESPFDWGRAALYMFPGKGYLKESDFQRQGREPYDQAAKRWANRLWPLIQKGLNLTEGRAFVLCTSAQVANLLYDMHLSAGLPWPAQKQGVLSKSATIEWFKSTSNPVLYATSSFWEGVDVPGDQLSAVMIDKIPFPNAGDPLEQAKMERLGRDSFHAYQIPVAITHLKQGVGRLIRTETDRGVLMLFDPRFHSKGYGKRIASALPGRAVAGLERTRTNISAFLSGFSPDARPACGPQETWAAEAVLKLSNDDQDRAAEHNQIGWNGVDSDFGHSLALQLRTAGALTDKQWSAARKLCTKYHRQVGAPPESEAIA